MSRVRRRTVSALAGAFSLAGMSLLVAGPADAHSALGQLAQSKTPHVRHVLLLSVDGLHQSDLQWYVDQHPDSTVASLVQAGTEFTNAQTPIPSDSFPGMVGQVTGGDPKTTGIYYDVTFNHHLLAPGTDPCQGVAGGAAVNFDESLDKDPTSIDAGQGLSGLPDSVMSMTGNPRSLITQAALPVDPATCKPVFPHNYLKVDTVFNVAAANHLHTAWCDKHPAYEILDGPTGNGVQDLFTPEINSNAPSQYLSATGKSGVDWTGNNFATRQYDQYKVQAVVNEIGGHDHSGTKAEPVPAVFGMNFQTISTAEKLPSSTDPTTGTSYTGGYLSDGFTPGPLLSNALDWLDGQLGQIRSALSAQHLLGSTAIILSAKHAQSPQNPADLTRVDDGTVIDGLDAAWQNAGHTGPLVASASDDDIMLLWLTDRSAAAADFARHWLLTNSVTGNTYNPTSPTDAGPDRTLPSSGLRAVYAGAQAASYFGVTGGDPRHPDVVGVAQHGVVYTGGTKKISEHGGSDPQDRDVPLVVDNPLRSGGAVNNQTVSTIQIAPTILRLLGLDPTELKAVKKQHTAVLPGA